MIFCKQGMEMADDLRRELFQRFFEFIRREDLTSLNGTYQLGNGARASVSHLKTSAVEEKVFESHEKFYDIHYVVKGRTAVYVCDRKLLKETVPYDSEKDCTLYEMQQPTSCIILHEGDMVILGPNEAHAPNCFVDRPEEIIKVMAKIPV